MDEYEYIVVVNIHLAYNLSSFFLLNIYNVYIVNTRSFVLKIKHTSSKLWHVLLLGKLVGTIRKKISIPCFGVIVIASIGSTFYQIRLTFNDIIRLQYAHILWNFLDLFSTIFQWIDIQFFLNWNVLPRFREHSQKSLYLRMRASLRARYL